MMLNEVTAQAGARHPRKRVGRGESSGHGKTCGRGNKGCQARSGGGTRPLHEGGQMPIFRRIPKRGFSNVQFRTEFQVVNLGRLESGFDDGAIVDLEALRQRGLIGGERPLIKVLGQGALSKRLQVTAHAFSAAARQAIENAGGTATLLERPDPAVRARQKRNKGRGRAGQPSATKKGRRAAPPSSANAGGRPAE